MEATMLDSLEKTQGRLAQTFSEADLIRLLNPSPPEESVERILKDCLKRLVALKWLGSKAALFLKDEKTGELLLHAHINFPEMTQIDAIQNDPWKSLLEECGQDKKIQFRAGVGGVPKSAKQRTGEGHYGVPLLSGTELLGVMVFYLPGKRMPRDRKPEDLLMNISNIISDMVMKEKTQEKLRQSNESALNILESITDGLVVIDRDWRFIYVNKAAAQIWGTRREYLIGKREWDFLPDFVHTPFYNEQHLVMTKKISMTCQMYFAHINKWFEFNIYPVTEGLALYFKDITEKKLADEKLREVQGKLDRIQRLSDIGTLAATVAHELRSPLAAMSVALYNLKRKSGSPELETNFARISKKIAESDQIINNLLFYSRLKAPQFEKVRMFEILKEAVASLNVRNNKNASIHKEISSLKKIVVQGDPLQLKEVFYNILHNALDALPPAHGKITISSKNLREGFIEIQIQDNGCGIDEDDLGKVYDPFFTTKVHGTGLGLSVCRQIVSAHEGMMKIDSRKGAGTTVSVLIPVRKKSE